MTTNVKTRKIDKLTVAAIIAVVALMVGMMLPCFQFPETVVYEKSLIVSERTNMHFKSVVVDVITIDEEGRVGEEAVRLHLEGSETDYRFTQEDLQEILQTEDEVYIKGLTDKALLQCSFFTPVVGILYGVLCFVAAISLFHVAVFALKRLWHNIKKICKTIHNNLRRKTKKD